MDCAQSTWAASVETQYAFGRPVAVPGFASSIEYHGSGLLHEVWHSNGVRFVQAQDVSGLVRPGSLTVERNGTPLWPAEAYGYDPVGNIRQIGTRRYGYDSLSRVTSAKVPGIVPYGYQSYEYDRFGNLTRMVRQPLDAQGQPVEAGGQEFQFEVDSRTNRMFGINGTSGASYTARGSLQSLQGSQFEWDRLDQLARVDASLETWVHAYDASGERVWSWRPGSGSGSTRRELHAVRDGGGRLLRKYRVEASGAVSFEEYAYREGAVLGSRRSDGTVRHYDVDHLGSVRWVTDASGTPAGARGYWPYGEEYTTPSSQDDGDPLRFTGHERDLGRSAPTAPEAAGDDLDYMHARYYKPIWGRFLSVDPVGGRPGAPQSWNRYSYVRGNPLTLLDPDGRTENYAFRDFQADIAARRAAAPTPTAAQFADQQRIAATALGPLALAFAPLATVGASAEVGLAILGAEALGATTGAIANPDRPMEGAVVGAYSAGTVGRLLPGSGPGATLLRGGSGAATSELLLKGEVTGGSASSLLPALYEAGLKSSGVPGLAQAMNVVLSMALAYGEGDASGRPPAPPTPAPVLPPPVECRSAGFGCPP